MKDFDNTDRVIKALAVGIRSGLEVMGEQATDEIRQSFDSGRDPTGVPWAPLAESTIRNKGHDTILVDSGEYRDSFSHDVTGGVGVGPIGGSAMLKITTDSEVAKWHEFGTSRMPARPIMQPTARWLNKRGVDRFEDHLQAAVTSAVVSF